MDSFDAKRMGDFAERLDAAFEHAEATAPRCAIHPEVRFYQSDIDPDRRAAFIAGEIDMAAACVCQKCDRTKWLALPDNARSRPTRRYRRRLHR